jgi:hypothetical protein
MEKEKFNFWSDHCSELAVGAFYPALSNYLENKRDPWKKLYQK